MVRNPTNRCFLDQWLRKLGHNKIFSWQIARNRLHKNCVFFKPVFVLLSSSTFSSFFNGRQNYTFVLNLFLPHKGKPDSLWTHVSRKRGPKLYFCTKQNTCESASHVHSKNDIEIIRNLSHLRPIIGFKIGTIIGIRKHWQMYLNRF